MPPSLPDAPPAKRRVRLDDDPQGEPMQAPRKNRKDFKPNIETVKEIAGWRFYIDVTPTLNLLPPVSDEAFKRLCDRIKKFGPDSWGLSRCPRDVHI